MMRHLFFIPALFLVLSFGCKSTPETQNASTEKSAPAAEPQSKLNQDGTRKLMGVVTAYYSLKDAFVASSAPKADEAASHLSVSTDSMISYLTKDSADALSMISYLDTIKSRCAMIRSVMDESTNIKRAHFEKVSDALFALLKQADVKRAGIYRQYCPMAFDDKGAYWLSAEEDIKNPYFGKKMLTCGEVRDSL